MCMIRPRSLAVLLNGEEVLASVPIVLDLLIESDWRLAGEGNIKAAAF